MSSPDGPIPDVPPTLTFTSDSASDDEAGLAPLVAERYLLGDPIGRGGMGTVLEARDRSLHRRVAVKVMLDSDQPSGDRLRRFVAEARITGQLEHPGVVPVYELGRDASGRPFYAMKRVRGTTLSALLERIQDGHPATLASYPLSALLTVFTKVCDAVAFAHSRGVVHRDLKPENIMVGDFGGVLVLDWGLAKVVRSAAPNGSSGPPAACRTKQSRQAGPVFTAAPRGRWRQARP